MKKCPVCPDRNFSPLFDVVDLTVTIRQALQQRELKKESQRLLKMVKRQSVFIQELEKQYPGITKVKRDARGQVIIDDEDEIDNGGSDTLIEQISETVKKCGAFFQGKG
jgi:hypothetical protein